MSAKVTFFANKRDGVGGAGDVGSHRRARAGQQGVRARVRAAGKALEGDDRQTHAQMDDSRKVYVISAISRVQIS